MRVKKIALFMVTVLVLLCCSFAVAGNVVEYTYDADGNIQDAVIPAPLPPTVQISANPMSILPGSTSTLSWTSTNAISCSIDQGIGPVPCSGAYTVSPSQTTPYTITATGGGGTTATDSVTVTVTENPPPEVTIAADPATIFEGGSSTLSWSSLYADTCEINQGIGAVPCSGTYTVSPTQTTPYTITASKEGGGTATDTVTVTVEPPPPLPTVMITANPESIEYGESSMLEWESTNADSCEIDQGIGTVNLNGSRTVSPTVTTTYTITAEGPRGDTATDEVTVTVAPPPEPTVSISADPITIQSGESTTLTWSSSDATECNIQPGIGDVGTEGDISVSPTETTEYIITATGPGGTATDSVQVTVWVVTAWKSPGSCASVDRGGNGWNNPAYAQVSDNNRANSFTTTTPSDWLQCTDFGFMSDIPSGATIGGIEVQIERSAETAGKIRDDAIYLRDSGGQVGDNKAVTGTYWPTSDAYAAYGGASDTWNAGLSDGDIRDSGFGIDISVIRDSWALQTEAFVDHVMIRVHYTAGTVPAPTVTISANPATIVSGQSSTLTWSSTNANSCSITPDIGTVSPNGSTTVSPVETTTYTITATGAGGTETDSVTITVTGGFPGPATWGADFGKEDAWHTGVADLDGDGKADFWQHARSGGDQSMYVWLSTGTGLGPKQQWTSDFGTEDNWHSGVADLDGDGKADFWQHARSGSDHSMYVWLSTGEGLSSRQTWASDFGIEGNWHTGVADLDGDGKADFWQHSRFYDPTGYDKNMYVWLSTGTGLGPKQTWTTGDCYKEKDWHTGVADLNGDGKADFWQHSRNVTDDKMYVWLSTGTGLEPKTDWDTGFGKESDYHTVAADFSGDGKADFAQHTRTIDGGDMFMWVSTGSGLNGPGSWGTGFSKENAYHTLVADFNGDDKADCAQHARTIDGDDKIYVWLSTGYNFEQKRACGAGFGKESDYHTLVADLDGDGKDDLAQHTRTIDNGNLSVWLSAGP